MTYSPLFEQNISVVGSDVQNALLNRTIAPSKNTVQLLSSASAPVQEVTPGDRLIINIPNTHPSMRADIYVKLVESDLKKRGIPANTFIDYNRLIFTSYDTQEDQTSISMMLGIPEGGFCVWTEGDSPKSPQYKPQLYILIARKNVPTEAFLSSIFSINTPYRCNNVNSTHNISIVKEEIQSRTLPHASNLPSMTSLLSTSPTSSSSFSTPKYFGQQTYTPASAPICSSNKLGTVHMHVDGDKKVSTLVAQLLVNSQITWKVTTVHSAIAGPQRDLEQFQQTYCAHTPGEHNGTEEFEQYMTIPAEEENLITPLRKILNITSPYKGFVVEVEQIIGKIDSQGGSKWINRAEADIIESSAVGFKRSLTHSYEVHFVLEIPNQGTSVAPIPLSTLMNSCTAVGMHMGGWFISTKGGPDMASQRWVYRSNHFEHTIDKDLILKQWSLIHSAIKHTGVTLYTDYSLSCTIERVLGVWNTSATHLVPVPQTTTNDLFAKANEEECGVVKDAEELAKWEKEIENVNEMWVITPHFLAEKLPQVVQTMEHNLRRNVKYPIV